MACCACDRCGRSVARQLNRERIVLGLVSVVETNRRAHKEPGNEQFAFWTVMLDQEHMMSNFLFARHSGKQLLTGISRAINLRLV
jgi:hypothetical protein